MNRSAIFVWRVTWNYACSPFTGAKFPVWSDWLNTVLALSETSRPGLCLVAWLLLTAINFLSFTVITRISIFTTAPNPKPSQIGLLYVNCFIRRTGDVIKVFTLAQIWKLSYQVFLVLFWLFSVYVISFSFIFFTRSSAFLRKELSLATNSDFLIPIINVHPIAVDLRYFKLWILINQII